MCLHLPLTCNVNFVIATGQASRCCSSNRSLLWSQMPHSSLILTCTAISESLQRKTRRQRWFRLRTLTPCPSATARQMEYKKPTADLFQHKLSCLASFPAKQFLLWFHWILCHHHGCLLTAFDSYLFISTVFLHRILMISSKNTGKCNNLSLPFNLTHL